VVDVVRSKDELGRYGEELAAEHLVREGLVVLDRNWRCREGELDVVARDRDGTVVFVEVKTRSSTVFGEPAEAVGPVKARRIRVLAARWLVEHPSGGAPLRFDVVSVLRRRGHAPVLQHLRQAF
jgi:putative endonuclease